MKFYRLENCDYPAVVWAKDKEQAIEKYSEEVCEINNEYVYDISEIDVDDVLKYILKMGDGGDDDIKMFGQAARLVNIIRQDEAFVVGWEA